MNISRHLIENKLENISRKKRTDFMYLTIMVKNHLHEKIKKEEKVRKQCYLIKR